MHLRHQGVQSGPLEADAVAQDFRAGRLAPQTLSWCAGEARWISLGKCWPVRRTRHGRVRFGLAGALLAAACGVAACRSHLQMLPFAWQTGAVLWVVVAVCVALVVIGLGYAWWALRRQPRVSLAVVLLTLLAVVVGMTALGGAGLSYGVLQLRQHVSNASVTYASAQHAIRISGFIGPRLEAQLRQALRLHPAARLVVLDSPGGLVEDALDTAAMIRAHGLATRADGICASACVAMWAAGARHQMRATARIGIHHLYSGVDLPRAIVGRTTARLTRQYDGFLRAAGFDEATIRRGNATASREMYWLNPLQVAAAGVELAVFDAQGVKVPPAMAQWLWVARGFGRGNAIGDLLLTIRTRAPSIALHYAYDFYAAEFVTRDSAVSRRYVGAVYHDAKRYALARAGDAATVAWARGFFQAFGGAKRYPWMCEVDTGVSAWTAISRNELQTQLVDNLDQLLQHVGPLEATRSWPRHFAATHPQLTRRAWQAAQHYRNPGSVAHWDRLDWCTYRLGYLGAALQLPQQQAAQAVRFIELQPSRVARR